MPAPLVDLTRNVVLAETVVIADTAVSRMRGLLGRPSLPRSEALVITRCNSVHMFFMKFPIDVLFVDKEDRVIGVVHSLLPWRLSPVFWKAAKAIELPAGVLSEKQVALGDVLAY